MKRETGKERGMRGERDLASKGSCLVRVHPTPSLHNRVTVNREEVSVRQARVVVGKRREGFTALLCSRLGVARERGRWLQS